MGVGLQTPNPRNDHILDATHIRLAFTSAATTLRSRYDSFPSSDGNSTPIDDAATYFSRDWFTACKELHVWSDDIERLQFLVIYTYYDWESSSQAQKVHCQRRFAPSDGGLEGCACLRSSDSGSSKTHLEETGSVSVGPTVTENSRSRSLYLINGSRQVGTKGCGDEIGEETCDTDPLDFVS